MGKCLINFVGKCSVVPWSLTVLIQSLQRVQNSEPALQLGLQLFEAYTFVGSTPRDPIPYENQGMVQNRMFPILSTSLVGKHGGAYLLKRLRNPLFPDILGFSWLRTVGAFFLEGGVRAYRRLLKTGFRWLYTSLAPLLPKAIKAGVGMGVGRVSVP